MVDQLGVPSSITVDHGTEFMSKALEDWAWRRGIKLDFIRPGKPIENAHIESFNGRFRDECLNVNQFTSMDDAGQKIEAWRRITMTPAPTVRCGTWPRANTRSKVSETGSKKAANSPFEVSQNGAKAELPLIRLSDYLGPLLSQSPPNARSADCNGRRVVSYFGRDPAACPLRFVKRMSLKWIDTIIVSDEINFAGYAVSLVPPPITLNIKKSLQYPSP